ncbi:PKD domain-containing protein [Scytonema hofmannii]
MQGKDVSHVFADEGIYTVTLTVLDSDGALKM